MTLFWRTIGPQAERSVAKAEDEMIDPAEAVHGAFSSLWLAHPGKAAKAAIAPPRMTARTLLFMACLFLFICFQLPMNDALDGS